jgi:pimeloyl-ACP methyl ester carboxylesterase
MIDLLLPWCGLEVRRVRTSHGALTLRATTPARAAPLLFVHGFGRGGAQLVPMALAFRGARTVLVPDLIGFGGGDAGGRTPDLFGHAQTLADVLDEYGPADVVGVSFGGWVATWLAARHPSSVRSLFLVNPAGMRAAGEELAELYRSTARAPELYRRTVGARPFLGVPLVSRALEAGFARALRDPCIGRFIETVREEHALEYALGEVACPTYALLSSEDRLLDARATADALLDRVPHVRGAWVMGASHNVGYEAFETLVEELARFLGMPGAPASALLDASAHLRVPPRLRPLAEARP